MWQGRLDCRPGELGLVGMVRAPDNDRAEDLVRRAGREVHGERNGGSGTCTNKLNTSLKHIHSTRVCVREREIDEQTITHTHKDVNIYYYY